jgi:hypothetical protein
MQNQILQVMREMKLSISMHNTRISSVMNIVNRVLEYFEMDSFNYRQLSRMLENDPVMSAYLLKAANVCMFNKPEHITRLDQACMMLGTSMLKTLMISHRWRACIAIRNPRIKSALIEEWQNGLQLAVASYTLAHQLRHPKTDDVFLNVMLENISLFLFAEHCDRLPEKDGVVVFRVLTRHFKRQYSNIILSSFNLAHIEKNEFSEGINRINLRDIKNLCAIHTQAANTAQGIQECYAFRKLPPHIALTYGKNQLLALRSMRMEMDAMLETLNFTNAVQQDVRRQN